MSCGVATIAVSKVAKIKGPTLFLGIFADIRHHEIDPVWKKWFSAMVQSHGFPSSGLAGLHIHFFMKTLELARTGDFGALITSSEWLDVNYGKTLRAMLVDGLGGVGIDIIDPRAQPFADAMVTGAITCFRVGQGPAEITMRAVNSPS